MRLESKDARFGPERPGEKPVALNSIVADLRYLPLESRFLVDEFAAKGPTFDGGLKAEIAPDGPGVSLKLDIKINPSVTQDVIRLWPQFINPDVRDWASHNLHGGRIEGTMAANWSAADLDAINHKRAVPRDSVHGTFSTRDVGVDLLPGLPMMVSEARFGDVHRPRLHRLRRPRDHGAVADPAHPGRQYRLHRPRYVAAADRRRAGRRPI